MSDFSPSIWVVIRRLVMWEKKQYDTHHSLNFLHNCISISFLPHVIIKVTSPISWCWTLASLAYSSIWLRCKYAWLKKKWVVSADILAALYFHDLSESIKWIIFVMIMSYLPIKYISVSNTVWIIELYSPFLCIKHPQFTWHTQYILHMPHIHWNTLR